METVIMKLAKIDLRNFDVIRQIIKDGYMETGCKFSVNLNGSKGYLDHIEIWCEGSEPVRLSYPLNGEMIKIIHSSQYGLSIEYLDRPR